MLPKANRLRHRQDFTAIYQGGLRRHSPHLALRALRRRPEGESREHPDLTPPTLIGVVVGSKVSKRSTIRNRVKRQIRAALRQLLPRVAPGWRLVIVARSTAPECDSHKFLRELEQLLADAEVIDGH